MPIAVELVSPEENLFEGEASFVKATTVEGDIGFLEGHIPILAQLAPSELMIRATDGQEHVFQIDGGFLVLRDDRLIILMEGAAGGEGDMQEPA
jgi:F-type H+-transporting ATPase subunit epsilon